MELKDGAAEFIQNMELAENSNAVEHILTIIDETLAEAQNGRKNQTKSNRDPMEPEPVIFDKTYPKLKD